MKLSFKIILTSVVLTAWCTLAVAQQDSMSHTPRYRTDHYEADTMYSHSMESDSRTTVYHRSRYRHDPIKTRWFLLDIGVGSYVEDVPLYLDNGLNPFDQDLGRSTNLQIHLYQQRINLAGGVLNLLHGLEFNIQEYAFANPVSLVPNQPELTINLDDGVSYRKNRLQMTYLTLPIMLNIETNPNHHHRSFRISAGVYGGLRLNSNLKQKSGAYGKEKIRDDFNLNKYQYGLRGQIGFGPINLYGTLNMSPLFDENQDAGAKLYPFAIGISLVPF
ncbi:MAG TPA: outer membrane beta-barrel protein [Saprospiraceae bacterium]|nr:outer membrane beta-barrel protein [Saprospiraceae bacterium]MCB9267956.1 outer membrane beta-barrel protein [Lewinellaceae bacterium]HPG07589.1 outer membrane beta-barrel protein [Saprospiraceae bacterium]HPR01825.1 outer membrane beta-barrel protein [Saprospiraceae bacterium]HQU53195.1 outer membrane beta-barrel protein [Saprospiraceae bacterium]